MTRRARALPYRAEVELTVESPDRRIAGRGERQILVRKYADKALRQPMVLCVVAEERAEETIVVTVYRSSRIEKYLPGAAP